VSAEADLLGIAGEAVKRLVGWGGVWMHGEGSGCVCGVSWAVGPHARTRAIGG